jgi:D-glycero-alpha-D-manno-heptose-7-phosphate kinase
VIIRSKAPLRISFAGGGTDVPPYIYQKGGAVFNTTIGKYVYATLIPKDNYDVCITSLDFDTTVRYNVKDRLPYDGQLDLAKAAVELMGIEVGFSLVLHSDAPPGCGLGTSSTAVVAMVGALKHWLKLPLSNYDIANLAYRIEREEVGIAGGKQDQYATTFGGMNFIEFLGDTTIVNPLRVPANLINELEYRLLLCYTGQTRLSAGIIEDQTSGLVQRKEEVIQAFDETKALAFSTKNALLLGKLEEFGRLLDEGWRQKKRLSTKITSPRIDELYQAAKEGGALGAKLLGAGGGGFLLVFCQFDKKQQVAQKLIEKGGQILDFGFEFQGLQTWTVNEQ